MDTGEGRFQPYRTIREAVTVQKKNPKYGGIFSIGEVIKIRGSIFKVQKIFGRIMTLQLQPKSQEELEELEEVNNGLTR